MKKGFTILELLVASLLLGMLVTILTMVFNQSSIAWRTGLAGVANLDEVRDNMAEVREEADNLFIHGGRVCRITGLWKSDGTLRERAYAEVSDTEPEYKITLLGSLSDTTHNGGVYAGLGSEDTGNGKATYTVGVTSLGPNPSPDCDYDDITTWPDEIEL